MTAIVPAALAAIAVRNPFWPVGYDGKKEVISPEPVVEVQVADAGDDAGATAAAAALAQQNSEKITDSHWRQARKTLKVSGTFEAMDVKTGRERQSVLINGKPYGDGDLISTNHDGNRFTWRVGGITEGSTLRLERIRAKPVPDVKAMAKKDGKEEKKGESKK